MARNVDGAGCDQTGAKSFASEGTVQMRKLIPIGTAAPVTRRAIATLIGTIMLITGGLLIAPPASADVTHTYGPITENCSWGSCSWYLSRDATRKLHQMLEYDDAATVGAGGVCAVLGVATAGAALVPCGIVATMIRIQAEVVKKLVGDAVEDHGDRGACFKVTRSHVGTIYPSTNNGKLCKDR